MYNSIYPVQIKPYVPPQDKKKAAAGANEEENESSRPNSNLDRDNFSRGSSSTDPNGKRYNPQEFPNGEKATIDYSKSKVNIAQILTDFKNTAIAIGSPPNIVQEVDQYLALAEAQSLKGEPNKKVIQSNLKNASNVLDDFISKTLNKKSKVVENWIEALFLQQVNYKSDPETINADFLVKLPDKQTGGMKAISSDLSDKNDTQIAQKAEDIKQANAPVVEEAATNPVKETTNGVYIPQDPQVRKSFLQGKKYAAIKDTQKALEAFQTSLSAAQAVGDKKAEGMICFEIGQLYDGSDNLEQALSFYNQAHKTTDDNNIKAKAYYSMAQIYDDFIYFEPAMEHYYAAISFAGEAENLNAQTKALADIGEMYAERYDKPKTHEYYDVAKNIALETNNNKTKGAIWSKSADAMTALNENVNALKDYKASAQFYQQADSPIKTAKNYEKASAVMLQLGNKEKAKALLEKARQIALETDTEYAEKLSFQLSVF